MVFWLFMCFAQTLLRNLVVTRPVYLSDDDSMITDACGALSHKSANDAEGYRAWQEVCIARL